eukprot:scaffold99138_cov30-Tisochrysis_lutea.AAC.5
MIRQLARPPPPPLKGCAFSSLGSHSICFGAIPRAVTGRWEACTLAARRCSPALRNAPHLPLVCPRLVCGLLICSFPCCHQVARLELERLDLARSCSSAAAIQKIACGPDGAPPLPGRRGGTMLAFLMVYDVLVLMASAIVGFAIFARRYNQVSLRAWGALLRSSKTSEAWRGREAVVNRLIHVINLF